MVRLKVKQIAVKDAALGLFQFQNGAVKRVKDDYFHLIDWAVSIPKWCG